MRAFIAGISGLLGLNIALQLRDRFEVTGCYGRHPIAARGVRVMACDLAEPGAAVHMLEQTAPDLVINAVGLTSVDACEAVPDLATSLNTTAAAGLAAAAVRIGARLVHVSTDHLFDGTAALRAETDPVNPLNVYARTKHEGEQRVLEANPQALILRTNFFGWGTSRRGSFSDWVLHELRQSRPLRMFDDVFFTPVLINGFVERALALTERGVSGVVHLGGAERVSKYDFGRRLARTFGCSDASIEPVSIEAAGLRAVRPRDMSLDSRRAEALLGAPLPSLDAELDRLRALEQQGWPRELEIAVAGQPR